jgi:hypothetical protein
LVPADKLTDEAAEKLTLDLMIGPDSAIVVGQEHVPSRTKIAEAEMQGILDTIWDVAKAVVPVVAKAGSQIYNELSKQSKAPASRGEVKGGYGVGDILEGVLRIAAPLGNALLGLLL